MKFIKNIIRYFKTPGLPFGYKLRGLFSYLFPVLGSGALYAPKEK